VFVFDIRICQDCIIFRGEIRVAVRVALCVALSLDIQSQVLVSSEELIIIHATFSVDNYAFQDNLLKQESLQKYLQAVIICLTMLGFEYTYFALRISLEYNSFENLERYTNC